MSEDIKNIIRDGINMPRRLDWDEPWLPLYPNIFSHQVNRCHPDETRPLTIREYVRVQSFPNIWEFAGSKKKIYNQIENAMPVGY